MCVPTIDRNVGTEYWLFMSRGIDDYVKEVTKWGACKTTIQNLAKITMLIQQRHLGCFPVCTSRCFVVSSLRRQSCLCGWASVFTTQMDSFLSWAGCWCDGGPPLLFLGSRVSMGYTLPLNLGWRSTDCRWVRENGASSVKNFQSKTARAYKVQNLMYGVSGR